MMIKSRNVLRSIADDIRQHFGLCFIHVFSKSQAQNNSENIYVKGREHMKYADRYGNRWEETGLQEINAVFWKNYIKAYRGVRW